MEVTDVRVFPVNEVKVKAYVTIVFDDCFIVRDLKVINGESKLFVAMPSKRMKDGSYRDMVHPLDSGTRQKVEIAVLDAYEKAINQQEAV